MATTARSSDPEERPRLRRRRLRRRRRLLGVVVLLTPTAWQLTGDLLRRAPHIATFDTLHLLGYAASFLASAFFWAVLLYNAASRRGVWRDVTAGLYAVLFLLCIGVQSAFFGLYGIYLSHDGQVYSRSIPQALLGHLPLTRPSVLVHLLGTLLFGLGLLAAARHWVRPGPLGRRYIAPLLVPAVLYGATQVPASYRLWQSTSPDIIYVHGLVSLIDERRRIKHDAPDLRVQRRSPLPVPALAAAPARPRNLLFILQESVRWDVECNNRDLRDDCATRWTHRAAPGRMQLNQLRANASTSAISISNLWSGVSPNQGFEELHGAPLLWDYAHAAGYDTGYWTSQNVMFGSMRLYVQDIPARKLAFATNLDRTADYDAGANDMLLTERVIADWDDLEEPFMGVVHYSNVHYPYVHDPEHAPFQPAELNKAASKNDEFFNFYKNVVYLSDRAVARLLDHVQATERGRRTVIVYTSDHGEAFREHWQLGHTSSLYDEEIKVPGWLLAPEGTLTADEELSIRGAEAQFIWHLDLLPTMLDLLGVWDLPALRPFRAKLIGNPITRPQRTMRPVPLQNCAWVWECGFRNWGLMRGHMKLEAREWDDEFHCFDLLRDPEERTNLGEQACSPLPDVARQMFGPMPFQEQPSLKTLLWGPPVTPLPE